MRRALVLTVFVHLCITSVASAQAPATGPLLLRVPATPRTAALGNAWVAGRDQDVLFYNPAQLIGARTGLDLSLIRFGADGTAATLGSVYAGGKMSLTLGWGVQVARYAVDPAATYPYSPDVLVGDGTSSGLSALAAIGGAVLYKGFRIGAAGKYAVDEGRTVVGPATDPGLTPTGVFLADLGVARNVLGGVAAFSAQNLGRRSLFPGLDDDEDDDDDGEEDDDDEDDVPPTIPRQLLMGWSMTRVAGPVDLGLYTQVLVRSGWTAPGAGLDVTWSWIEGCFVSLRAGARRPETTTERPYAFGGALTIDRATLEYSIQFFDDGRHAHGVTFRWR
jgi:hypothetical protein